MAKMVRQSRLRLRQSETRGLSDLDLGKLKSGNRRISKRTPNNRAKAVKERRKAAARELVNELNAGSVQLANWSDVAATMDQWASYLRRGK